MSPSGQPVADAVRALDARGDPSLFNDREVSFLRFLERVLSEARQDANPLLDRVKFLAIVGTHLDDFVRVRTSELRRHEGRRLIVESMVKRLLYDVSTCWRRLAPALRAAGIRIRRYGRLGAEERLEADRYFSTAVLPQLDPLPCDPAHPFPLVPSLGMNVMIDALAETGASRCFVLRIPESLPALVPIPASTAAAATCGEHPSRTYVWLDQLVMANVHVLFPGLRVIGAHRFRLLREVDIPAQTVAGGNEVERVLDVLRRRETNPVAVLVADRRMPAGILASLAQGVGIPAESVHRTGTVSDLRRLWEVCRIARPDLKAPHIQPRTPAPLGGHADVLAAARERDILFHHPYESFQPIVEMIKQAADDPSVLSISTTLYRTDRESPMVHALLDAAGRGRTIRVLIELNARLDEHRNVNWWRAFEQAGAQVFASPPGLKVHAKMTLIDRQEGHGVRRYAHLSSGNYNAFTARVYTDLGLLTCDDDITADVASLFDGLCGGASTNRFLSLAVSPLTLRQTFAALVDREIACHRRSGSGHIILKMNSLVDRDVIRMLYRASQEGVTVDLLVRGICCLRPGVPGISDRIRVRSIVGRFLEHSRAWYFRSGGQGDVYIGSADLMPRNLDRRVEVMAPVKDPVLRRRVLDILLRYMADSVKARELRADGRYARITPPRDRRAIDTQLELLHDGAAVRFGE